MSSESPHILLAEDDPNLGSVLKEYLELKGFSVLLCRDGEEGLNTFRRKSFDLCIFDIMMPKMDGFTLMSEIRKIDKRTPVLFLTAKSLKEDVISGFKLGADDYLTKPFSMEELLLRIGAILRRTSPERSPEEPSGTFKIGKFTFRYDKQLLDDGVEEQKLSSKEADLLRLLTVHANSILYRPVALKQIWGDDSYFNSRSMDVYIAKLRKRLKADPNVEILNIHGEGFRLLINR